MEKNKIDLFKIKGELIKKKKGFTLVELMVVLAIIATMTFIAVPNFTSIKASVNQKVDDQSCEAIKRIVATFIADETIKVSSTETVSFTYDANSNNGGGVNGISEDSKDILNDALSDVKPPRVDNSMLYKVEIEKNGKSVVVTTGKTTSEKDNSKEKS